MASIFTGLAFMHGHIVDRDLAMRLGRDEPTPQAGAGAPAPVARPRKEWPRTVDATAVHAACPTCC